MLASATSRAVHPLLHLQRTIGNHAVVRLLKAARAGALEADSDIENGSTPDVRSATQITSPFAQTCATKQPSPAHQRLQTKKVGSSSSGQIAAPTIVNQVLASPGRPLNASSRAFFEPRFGHDFSRVRVHTDAPAAKSARAVNSLAYTVGNHIVFGSGQYEPTGSSGQKLLAHELTHVIQQQAGRVSRRVIQRAEIPYQQITWADFQMAPPSQADPKIGAEITTKFDLIPSYSGISNATPTKTRCKVGKGFEVEATVAPEPSDFTKPEAAMVQEKSWSQARFQGDVKDFCRGRKDVQTCINTEVAERARLLKHEQGHFDITHVMAKNMRESQSLMAKNLPVKETRCGDQAARDAAWEKYRRDVVPVLTDLAKEWLKQRAKAQGDYDTETGRGGNQKMQSGWETSIQKGLPTYYPATAPKPTVPKP